MYIPDNNDIFDYFESEQARRERIRRREEIEEELPFETVPNDYGTHEHCYPDKEGK